MSHQTEHLSQSVLSHQEEGMENSSGTFLSPPPFQLMASSDPPVQRQGGEQEGESAPEQVDPNYGAITTESIRQGGLNDCYLMAALASLAGNASGRDAIRDAVALQDDGTFVVRLYSPLTDGTTRRMSYRVPAAGMENGARRAAPWVRAIETAYALHYGGEETMGGSAGGSQIGGASRAMMHITGQDGEAMQVSQDGADATWTRIQSTIQAGGHVIARTPSTLQHDFDAPGVYGNHAYAVQSVSGEGGNRQITLYNPWGVRFRRADREEASQMGLEGDSGSFTIPFTQFVGTFVQIQYDRPGTQAEFPARPAGAEGSESAPQSDQWTALKRQFDEHLQTGGGVSTSVANRMLRMATENATFPASLPRSIPSTFSLYRPINASIDELAGVAQPDEVFRHPDIADYWSCVRFSIRALTDTLAYASSIVEHELLHIADMYAALAQFNGQGAGAEGGQEAGETSGHGTTEADFVHFWEQSRGGSQERHAEIYAEMASGDRSTQWSSNERLTWLRGAIHELPLNLGPDDDVPSESAILTVFGQLDESGQHEIWDTFMRSCLSIDPDSPSVDQRALGLARTRANHFDPIWNSERGRSSMAQRVRERFRLEAD